MAQCKWCNRSGWFFSVNQQGLCKNCAPVVALEIASRVHVLSESTELIHKSKKIDTKLSRCDLIIEYALALEKYEQRGIPVLETPPSAIIAPFKESREQMLLEAAQAVIEAAKSKAAVSNSAKSKVAILSKAFLAVRDYTEKSTSKRRLAELQARLHNEIQQIQLQGYLGEAKKAEFKGQRKKALDQYYEALYFFLKHDDVDDSLQKGQIEFIERKIVSLGGKLQDV